MSGGLALAILRYDEGDGFNRSGTVTEAHAMTLELLAAVFRIPGTANRAETSILRIRLNGSHALYTHMACSLLVVC